MPGIFNFSLAIIVTFSLMSSSAWCPFMVLLQMEDVIGVCHSHPQLMYAHRAVLHTLLVRGLQLLLLLLLN